jgi:hypothetical protein
VGSSHISSCLGTEKWATLYDYSFVEEWIDKPAVIFYSDLHLEVLWHPVDICCSLIFALK